MSNDKTVVMYNVNTTGLSPIDMAVDMENDGEWAGTCYTYSIDKGNYKEVKNFGEGITQEYSGPLTCFIMDKDFSLEREFDSWSWPTLQQVFTVDIKRPTPLQAIEVLLANINDIAPDMKAVYDDKTGVTIDKKSIEALITKIKGGATAEPTPDIRVCRDLLTKFIEFRHMSGDLFNSYETEAEALKAVQTYRSYRLSIAPNTFSNEAIRHCPLYVARSSKETKDKAVK
tara:strand:+ start:1493 stop:2179 length:687 start_codon:yes stop_codon:yes gene_type:complete